MADKTQYSQTPFEPIDDPSVPGAWGLTPAILKPLIESRAALQLLDVRREPAYCESGRTMVGALRIRPETLIDHFERIDRHRIVVSVCVHGHEVSQSVAKTLWQCGYDAYFLVGGFEEICRQKLLPLKGVQTPKGSDQR